ncbi:MAG: UbiD family decarboxylase [Chloroflexi bacterium]|nr:UbiD family decarboxylase [Chloroflexota bacterium]
MNPGLRAVLDVLQAHDQLRVVDDEIDPRYISPLVARASRAVLFRRVRGYELPVVSGLLSDRRRLALCLGMEGAETAQRLRRAIDLPIPPVLVADSPVKEVVLTGDAVDLSMLPIPVMAERDGGPFIASAVAVAEHSELGRNAGIYRLMYRNRNTLGIDIVTPNNLRALYEEANARGEALPLSIAIGAAPIEMLAATFKAPAGADELAVAGGLRGEPLALVPGETIPVAGIANAEIILEAELLPGGHVHPEGQFGEFTRLMGGVHRNPLVRVRAITMRRDAIFYALQMPWENIYLGAPVYEAAAYRVLREAGVRVTAVNITPGGCCHWHVVAAIKAAPGDGKNALTALLSVADFKHAIVTDDDIDIFDPVEVEWAVATRVQADRDVVIISGARAKPLDPSLPQTGGPVVTAKMGIDATIPLGVPRERYTRITYPFLDRVGPDGSAPRSAATTSSPEAARAAVLDALAPGPRYYVELLAVLPYVEYRTLVRVIGELDEAGLVGRDDQGRLIRLAGAR